ncbi:ester cyclase [Microbacterium enclense]|uniref:ester cyclase n=1 Tax=Microbacterium enclense TaxID=993073 RepID=UPI003F80E1D1
MSDRHRARRAHAPTTADRFPAVAVDNGGVEPWETREWFADVLDALNRHDLDDLRGFLQPGVRRAHLPAGADAWIEEYADLLHGFPDWQWKRIQLLVEDDRLAVHLRGGGTHTGVFALIAATRRRVSIASFAMWRVEHGRIAEASGTDDAAQIRAAIG